MTLDQWRARYEELDAETARLRAERDAARAEVAELQALIDLQRTRMDAARALWQDAHPEKKNVWPDLGDLLEWLMQERDAALSLPDAAEEVRGWKRDAERYRHIRAAGRVQVADVTMEGAHYHLRFAESFVPAKLDGITDEQARFDAVVDAAMAAKEKG